jgi:hypothetical protein
MWGIGLEHEVRLGFSKNIKPNLYLLVEYLKEKEDDKSQTLLKLINKKFDKDIISDTQEDKSKLQIRNINHIFRLRIDTINKVNIDSVYIMLEQVTILAPSDASNVVKKNIQNNIINHYIENYNTLKKSNLKVFKEFNNNINLTNDLIKLLKKKKLYSDRLNKSEMDTVIELKSKSIKKLKYFEKEKIKNKDLNQMYKRYIEYNYYRFINGNVRVDVNLQGREVNYDIFLFINDLSSEQFWNFNFFSDLKLQNIDKKSVLNMIQNFKNYYINKMKNRLSILDKNKKELFPDFKKSSINMKAYLSQRKSLKNTIGMVTITQILNIEKPSFKLLSKYEIYQQFEYLLDVYIYLSNKKINFINLSVDTLLEVKDTMKIEYPIKYLINMNYDGAISIDGTDSGPLIEYKNLKFKNVQIENVLREVEIYQNIVTNILNKEYQNSDYFVYGEIIQLERGGDKNLIYLDSKDGRIFLDNHIWDNDYFGSYHLWLTMPSKNINSFVDEHIDLATLLQWCEPLFFVFYTNNIYNDFGSYRYLLNNHSGYGTSDPRLLKERSNKFEIYSYYDGRDENKLLDKVANREWHGDGNIKVYIFDKNDKKIINYNLLAHRDITIDEINKRFECDKKKVKTYLDILWETSNKEDMSLGADIRTGDTPVISWSQNFEPSLLKNWRPITVRKKNNKFYRYYYNYMTNKLTDTPPYSKTKSKNRVGFEFRVFDNMNIKYMYNIMYFSILVYVAVLHKKKKNLSLAIQSQAWNNTIANCLLKGINNFKLSTSYTKKFCELLEIETKHFDNMVDFFQYLIDRLHNKYMNNSIFKKIVRNHKYKIKIPNINLYYQQLNRMRQKNEMLF